MMQKGTVKTQSLFSRAKVRYARKEEQAHCVRREERREKREEWWEGHPHPFRYALRLTAFAKKKEKRRKKNDGGEAEPRNLKCEASLRHLNSTFNIQNS